MKNVFLALSLVIFLCVPLAGRPLSAKELSKQADKKTQTQKADMNQELQEFRAAMGKKLDRAKVDLEELKRKSKREVNQATEQSKKAVDDVDRHIQTTEEKMKELGDASSDAWSEFKSGVEKSMDELEKSLKRAREHFKS